MKYIAAGLLVLIFSSAPSQAADTKCPAPQAVARVDGMVCDFCAQSLKKVLLKEEGVKDVGIDLTTKEVRITLAQGAQIDDKTINEKVDWAGYKVTSITHDCAQ